MRFLITGAGGFVAPYFYQALRTEFDPAVTVIPTSKSGGTDPTFGKIISLDVTDQFAVRAAVALHRPTHIMHLAGIASPVIAKDDPDTTWRVHVKGALSIANAVLEESPNCCILHVGSGLVYGTSALDGLPLDERALLAPIDEYSATKAAADLAVGAFVRRGLRCVRLRPFNHTGPGQTGDFVIPSFAMQIAQIESGLIPPVIHVGNLNAERDMLDVRDVAMAYVRVAQQSSHLQSGTILNISSDQTFKVQKILDKLLDMSTANIDVKQDPTRMRENDLPKIVGDSSRARKVLDWKPQFTLDETLLSVLNYWRALF